jgi:hypothetical protein
MELEFKLAPISSSSFDCITTAILPDVGLHRFHECAEHRLAAGEDRKDRRLVDESQGDIIIAITGGTLMPHGKICYLEIPANRAEDSARFYADIFGWKVRERGDGNLAFDDTGGVSGTWVKEGDRTPEERTRTYIMVDSIAQSLKRIEMAGGRIVTPHTDIGPDMGAFAAFADPVGNEFGLYEEPKR